MPAARQILGRRALGGTGRSDRGDLPDLQPSHDAIDGSIPVTHLKLQFCHVHDANRTLLLMRDFEHVLIQDCYFARSGQLQEVSSINAGNTSDLTVRRNVFEDSEQTFVSLRGVDNVWIHSNVFFSRLEAWSVHISRRTGKWRPARPIRGPACWPTFRWPSASLTARPQGATAPAWQDSRCDQDPRFEA